MNKIEVSCCDCGANIDFDTSFNDGEVSLCSDCHANYIIRTKGDTHNEGSKKT